MTTRSTMSPELRRRALKSRDAWWTVLVIDPLSLPVLSVLVRLSWVTPMRLTAGAAVLGAASVAAFGTSHLVLGAVLFELRFFLDCLDGKLARIRGLASPRGAFFDLSMDVLLVSGAMAALGWHVGRVEGPVALGVSLTATFVCLILFWLILWDIDHPSMPSAADGSRRSPESRLRRWMRHRRLNHLPHNVEVETLLLFLIPLTSNERLLAIAFAVALVYYLLASLRLFIRLFRRAPLSASAPDAGPNR